MSTASLIVTSSLYEEIDKKLLVVMRDGRKLIGNLRSFDQFANIVLEETTERIYVGNYYGDIPLGLFVIRGENVVLIGEVDEEKERNANLTKLKVVEILNLYQKEQQALSANNNNININNSNNNTINDSIIRNIRSENAIIDD